MLLVNQKGFTLAEVSIAALLLAIGATGIFAVVLTCRYNVRNNQAREEIQHYARKLTEDLKGYVRSTDSTDATNAPAGTWVHPNDPSNSWALEVGEHNVTTLLPDYLRDAPFNATMRYTVSLSDAGNTNSPRQIDVRVQWTEAE